MIHRTYIAQIAPYNPYGGYELLDHDRGSTNYHAALRQARKSQPQPRSFSPGSYLDIIVSLPGSRAAPVLNSNVWPGVVGYTQAPTDWCTACDPGWYYEIRSRSLRLENLAGANGFVPRTNLGYHLSICQLQDPLFQVYNYNQLPTLELSATLALPPVADPILDPDYAEVFPDPSYGPVIRLWNPLSPQAGNPLYLVNFMLQENKDEDFTTLGAI